MAVKIDLTVDQGRDFRHWFGFRNAEDQDTVTNPDGTKGSYEDLVGSTFKAQVRDAEAAQASLIVEFTVDATDKDTTSDIYLVLTDTQTDTLYDSKGYYDLVQTYPDGTEKTRVFGKVTFQGRPTSV